MRTIFNFQFSNFKSESGQSLVTLLFFMVIGITVISAAALIVTTDILAASNNEKGLDAYYAAESGVEDGVLYLLSHPTYTGTLPVVTIDSGQATISIQSNGTITSVGTDGTTKKTVQAVATYSGGTITVSGWREQ